MPSPFPAMDPYLEQQARWSGVHSGLIAVLREALTRQVAPVYFVDSEDHVYLLPADDRARSVMRPDIFLVRAETVSPRSAQRQIGTPTFIEPLDGGEMTYPCLEIRDIANRDVVATIEVLSPINKLRGSEGQRDFQSKRERVLRSNTQWIEIDLLRDGSRPVSRGTDMDYYAALHRAGEDTLAVWAWRLREQPPIIAVPLRAPSPDAPLICRKR